MNKKLFLMSVLFATSTIINSGFGANLEVDITNTQSFELSDFRVDDRTFKFNTPEELNEFIAHDKLSALSVNDLIELAGDVKQLSSPRYANHDFFQSEMISGALDKILIESATKKEIYILTKITILITSFMYIRITDMRGPLLHPTE